MSPIALAGSLFSWGCLPVLLLSRLTKELTMSNKVYVGNLSFRVTSEDLQEYFAGAGTVESANVVFDRETGRSRGFGFVELATVEDANSAIAQFNGQEYEARNIVVNEAKPREDRGGRGNGGGYGGGWR